MRIGKNSSFAAADGAIIPYEVRKSSRARAIRLSVYAGGRVVVTLPQSLNPGSAKKTVEANGAWLLRKVAAFKNVPEAKPPRRRPPAEIRKLKGRARALVLEEIQKWNSRYAVPVRKIAIKDLRSKWGSCSRAGTLNFNYRIVFLPPRLASYLVVHELCHLRELNHSSRFWNLVSETVPDWKEARRELRRWPIA